MGCATSQEADVPKAESNYRETTVDGVVVKKKGTLASSTGLTEYRQMMEELGAVDESERPADSDDEFCDARQVRLSSFSDQNSTEPNGGDDKLLFETAAEASTSTPTGSLIIESVALTTMRRTRRFDEDDASLANSLPGSVDEKLSSPKKIAFSPDTPFIEGKPFPVSKRVKALELLKKDIKQPVGRV